MYKILIVEDEVETASLIALSLEKEGFDCSYCPNDAAVLEVFNSYQPDVVILDLKLPGSNELELCDRIRQQREGKDPLILILTSKGQEVDRLVGLSGANDYLVKPISSIELITRIRALLQRFLNE